MTKPLSAPPLELDWSQFGPAVEFESPSELSTVIRIGESGLPEPIVEEVSLAEWEAIRAIGSASA